MSISESAVQKHGQNSFYFFRWHSRQCSAKRTKNPRETVYGVHHLQNKPSRYDNSLVQQDHGSSSNAPLFGRLVIYKWHSYKCFFLLVKFMMWYGVRLQFYSTFRAVLHLSFFDDGYEKKEQIVCYASCWTKYRNRKINAHNKYEENQWSICNLYYFIFYIWVICSVHFFFLTTIIYVHGYEYGMHICHCPLELSACNPTDQFTISVCSHSLVSFISIFLVSFCYMTILRSWRWMDVDRENANVHYFVS